MNYKCYLGSLLVFGLGFGAGHFREKNIAEKAQAAAVTTAIASGTLDGKAAACTNAVHFLSRLGFPIPLGCQIEGGEVYYVSPAFPGKFLQLDGSGFKE